MASTSQPAVAIIGLSGRFPGAGTIESFWKNLCGGVEAVSFFSDAEMESEGLDGKLFRLPTYVAAKAVIEGIELFDASFFGFTPREAEILDPQHRLFLECAWEAIEDAGYDPEECQETIGVFAGAGINTYLLNNLLHSHSLVHSVGGAQIAIGNDKDYLATRVSYKLNLRGPSLTVQTACSTSLVAVCLAWQSLQCFQTDIALAGGVCLTVPNKAGYFFQREGIASPDGHCRAFDAEAAGTVPGNGVGIVVLKRLAEAVADGDSIYAVILGTAVNNDGAAKVGYTAPGLDGQADVIAMAQAVAGVNPETITYVEAHGTGTPLGDPIEVAALNRAFQAGTAKRGFCALGSVKTNIGHLDAAAGVAGLIKTTLALKHGLLPPSLHYQRSNPLIDFSNSPFYVNTQLRRWESLGAPRRAGVSSFGIGGTNAHVVLEEAPIGVSSRSERAWHLLIVSARTANALEQSARVLNDYLQAHIEISQADAAWTLQVGRRRFAHRRVWVCREGERGLDKGWTWSGVEESRQRPVTFLFPGEGSQRVQMGGGLYGQEGTFREQIDRCAKRLQGEMGLDLREVLYPAEGRKAAAASLLEQTWVAQPALFVVEYALAQLWLSWGVRPRGMLGHSLGEYVAACLAGVLELEEALSLVAKRGRLMQDLPRGAMLTVGQEEQPAVEAFRARMKHVRLGAPQIPYISNITGTWIRQQEAQDPEYWVRHLLQTVRLGDGMSELSRDGGSVWLEVGAGDTSSAWKSGVGTELITSLPAGTEEPAGILQALGRLVVAGVAVDWKRFHASQRRRVSLPTYPFERQRYWIGPAGGTVPSEVVAEEKPVGMGGAHRRPALENDYEAPKSDLERLLVTLWEDLLGIDGIGTQDNFFELGGHSLLGTQLLSRLREMFPIEISLSTLFEKPTINVLAEELRRQPSSPPLETIPRIERNVSCDGFNADDEYDI